MKITNKLAKDEEASEQEADMNDIATHMMFNRSTIEELSQEDSLENDDGGLTDDQLQTESLLEERIPNGGSISPMRM